MEDLLSRFSKQQQQLADLKNKLEMLTDEEIRTDEEINLCDKKTSECRKEHKELMANIPKLGNRTKSSEKTLFEEQV